MNLLLILAFGVLGILLDKAFAYQVEPSKPRPKSSWYAKAFDVILMAVVLLGVVMSIYKFPFGLAGLIAGAIFGWMIMLNDTTTNESFH